MQNVVGIDIGGTKISIVHAQYNNKVDIKDKTVFDTNSFLGPETVVQNIVDGVKAIVDKNSIKDYVIGISCGGPLNSKTGTILGPPNLPGWNHVEIVDILTREFNVETYLQNDADACAIAEWKVGAGKDCDNMIFLTFGTGLGAGMILNGKLYSGASGMAGEVGHIRLSDFGPVGYGKVGSFEGFCSGGGIAQLAQTILLSKIQSGKKVSLLKDCDIKDITAKDIFLSANAGDEDALEVVQVVGEYLGKGLSVLIDVLNPERIIIGSIYTRNHELLSLYASKAIEQEALKRSAKTCSILPAKIGEQIGDYAAVLTAIYGIEEVKVKTEI